MLGLLQEAIDSHLDSRRNKTRERTGRRRKGRGEHDTNDETARSTCVAGNQVSEKTSCKRKR